MTTEYAFPEDGEGEDRPRRLNTIRLSHDCTRWVVARAILRRPYLLFVSRKHIHGLARRLFWKLFSQFRPDDHDRLAEVLEQTCRWLCDRDSLSWWARLLLRWALPAILQLVVQWLAEHREAALDG